MPRYNPFTIMGTSGREISVGADSVDVEWNGPYRSKAVRFFTGSLFVAAALFVSLVHGKDPSLWDLLSNGRSNSGNHLFEAVFLSAIVIVIFAWGIRCFLPFGERMHCDRTTLTWSRIPWISFGNRWITRTVPPSEISHAHYGLAYKKRGGDLYGVLLEVCGERWKMFAGIESPEANRILHGLKGLGVNVDHDPAMRFNVRETLRDRRAQL